MPAVEKWDSYEAEAALPAEICLHFSECVSEVTLFQDWLNNPMGVCDCLNSAEEKSSLENGCAKLHNATRWEGAAGVCARACVLRGGV